MFCYTGFYNKKANMEPISYSIGNKLYKLRAKFLKTVSKPPHFPWLKWNTDASRILAKGLTTVSYVCKDNKGRIVYCMGRRN